MEITISKDKLYLRKGNGYMYTMVVRLSKENNDIKAFINRNKFIKEGEEYISIFKYDNEEFLKLNNIEYIIENDEIIPIGIVDFSQIINYKGQNYSEYNDPYLLLVAYDTDKDLYKCDKILKNIQRAIEIKSRALQFNYSCDNEKSVTFKIRNGYSRGL